MANFILILICLLAGQLLRKVSSFPKDGHKALNIFIIYIALPAVAFRYVPLIEWSASIVWPFLSQFLVFGIALIAVWIFSKIKPIDTTTRGALLLTMGLSNTSFVGFPLVETWYGSDAIKIALLSDQGAFFVLSILGIGYATWYAEGYVSVRYLMKRIITFPPFIAFLIAISISHMPLPAWWNTLMEKLSAPLVPLALVSVSLQISFKEPFDRWSELGYALMVKLLLAPAVVMVLLSLLTNLTSLYYKITVFEAAMAPMVTSYVVASQFRLNSGLAGYIVGIGILLSLLTTAGWYWVLENILTT
ncbi:AEC family transporter [Thermaurantimonas aggregans]|uniref:AEC family transporter n=1 Tax=Thermaurantimonas aggregans TaxID=2173829 RepID=UPI0023F40141|nr:AEC family transporter [Thermaurantimonas aggregans]MCX8149856.1 AEC family transporter [Thermaurantimonas aggregans]